MTNRDLFQRPFSLLRRSYYKFRVNLNNLSYIKAQAEDMNQVDKESLKTFCSSLMLTNAMSLK
jgi:regulator of sigma D